MNLLKRAFVFLAGATLTLTQYGDGARSITVLAQSSSPSPSPTPRAGTTVPGTISLPPLGIGGFGRPLVTAPGGGPAPGGPSSLTVISFSGQPLSLRHTGTELTVTAPAGYLVRFLSGCDGPLANPSSCAVGVPRFASCVARNALCEVTFTTVDAVTLTQRLRVPAGCANVSGQWRNDMPAAELANCRLALRGAGRHLAARRCHAAVSAALCGGRRRP